MKKDFARKPAQRRNQPPQTDEAYEVPPLQSENPDALYADANPEEQIPESSWNSFRYWSHKSKRWIYLAILISIVGGFILSLRPAGPPSFDGIVSAYFQRCNDSSRDWQYNIGTCFIPKDQIEHTLLVLADLSPGGLAALADNSAQSGARDIRTQFARDQYETDLLLHACIQTECLKQDEARLYAENALRHAVAEYYLLHNAPESIRHLSVTVTDEEVEEVYRESRDRYTRAGLERSAALAAIRSTLFQGKLARRNQALLIEREKLLSVIKDQVGPKFHEK